MGLTRFPTLSYNLLHTFAQFAIDLYRDRRFSYRVLSPYSLLKNTGPTYYATEPTDYPV